MKHSESIELKIANVLKFGVLVSGLFITIGWFMSFAPEKDIFAPLKTYIAYGLLDRIQVHALLNEWGQVISYLGLGLLISLPVIRVFFLTFLFLKQNEKMMALLSAIVLVGLLFSFNLGAIS